MQAREGGADQYAVAIQTISAVSRYVVLDLGWGERLLDQLDSHKGALCALLVTNYARHATVDTTQAQNCAPF